MVVLPESISPCANVRKTCYAVMEDPSFEEDENGNGRSVIIDDNSLEKLGDKITHSILSQAGENNDSCQAGSKTNGGKASPPTGADDCISNLQFAAWDEGDWHYTGKTYGRAIWLEKDVQKQRFERVALYIMVMDCINFCFWPVDQNFKKNLLEYEHLASALKLLAEKDDNTGSSFKEDETSGEFVVRAENSYVFAPQNLIQLTCKSFLEMMAPLLPADPENETDCTYSIPNVNERVRLLVEMGQSLIYNHEGSATNFIAKANHSSDKLVYQILQSFPGFRDATVDSSRGRWVSFYKRAQILVADLWAALGSESGDLKHGSNLCNFRDMDKITTFADYRVPQLLREMGVLKYSPSLSQKVDAGREIQSSSMDEIYIRASTVVAVDSLVKIVKDKTKQNAINAVKMDWYLWNIGEKLDREGSLGNHHLVNTIFY